MTDGTCYICGETYTGRGMSRHLGACLEENADAPGRRTMHLAVSDARRSEYWLHLGAAADATLDALDSLLRELWLECCGHMSAFDIGRFRYEKPYVEDGGALYDRRDMDVAVGSLLEPDAEVTYEYDFGTASELTVRVVDVGPYDVGTTPTGYDSVGVYARNHPPEIPCEGCADASADGVCVEHLHYPEEPAWFCPDCSDDHDCEDRLFLPVVNSPRTGLCGFTGARLTDWEP